MTAFTDMPHAKIDAADATPDLVTFIHDLRYKDLPDDVVVFAQRWLLDLIGVAAGGSSFELSRIIRTHALDHFAAGRRGSRMLFDGRLVSPAGAALAGGMTIDALDGHDGHKLTKGHVGCGILPALLALYDTKTDTEISGRDFITSLVLGYEIGSRAGIALHQSAIDYHTSGAWIAVTCAALGARALGLDRSQTRHALGIAEYHGPRSQMMRCIDHPTMVKDGSGWGAMAGVSAAFLAADGFTGAPALTVEAPELAGLWSDLGHRWRIFEQYFKPYPVCRWAQPPVRAILDLRARHNLTSDQVERIEISTFHESKRLAVQHPLSTEEAQYSTSFPAAVAMVHGDVRPQDVTGEALADPEVLRLSGSMRISENQTCNDAFPARRLANVALLLCNGQRLESGLTEATGDPEYPATDQEIRKKYHAWARPVLGEARTIAIEAAVDRLSDMPLEALSDLILSASPA